MRCTPDARDWHPVIGVAWACTATCASSGPGHSEGRGPTPGEATDQRSVALPLGRLPETNGGG